MKELNSQICKLDQLICWRDSRDYLIVSHIRDNIFNRWGFYNNAKNKFPLTSHHYNFHHKAQYGKTLNLNHAFKTVTETFSFINRNNSVLHVTVCVPQQTSVQEIFMQSD